MTSAVTLNPQISTPALVAHESCCRELIACIQAIWNSVYAWISDLASRLLASSTPTQTAPTPSSIPKQGRNLAKDCFNAFRQMTRFLEPVEIAQCEAVNKSWEDERIWQAQGIHYKMTAPASGKFKDRFKEIHAMAFGKKAWKDYLKATPGDTPRLPIQVYRDAPKLQATHILTLIPQTVDGKALSFNTFAPIAEKAGMKLNIWETVSEKYGSEPVAKAIWAWMEKDVKPDSPGKTQIQAEQDYPNKLGKALYYTISIVAHYARHTICLMPQTPQWTYARTCDGGQDQYDGAWFVIVGGSAPGVLSVHNFDYVNDSLGVAGLVPAHSKGLSNS
jgi:hypothetical protein